MTIPRDFQSIFSTMVDIFPVAKMFKVQRKRDRNMDTITQISVADDQPLLLYSEN